MRIVEVLRHTMRRKPGAHLSQPGIVLAKRVAKSAGPYDLVVTSPLPRAVETAIAMGFEVDETLEALGDAPPSAIDEIGWPNSFSGVMQAVVRGGACSKIADNQAVLWRQIAGRLSNSERALLVTHGGIVELGAVASLPDANHRDWGDAIGYCEGVRLFYDAEGCRGIEIIRLPQELRLIAS
jgi:hypothetical protein